MDQALREAVMILLRLEIERLEFAPYDGTNRWLEKRKDINRLREILEKLKNE